MAGRGQVDDAQTVRTEADMVKRHHAAIVGATMVLELAHPVDERHVLFLNWRDTRNPEGGGSEVYVERIAGDLFSFDDR